MTNKFFKILQGNNGATYIVNAKDRKSINDSLKFYKARNFKSKFLKAGFKVLLLLQGKLYAKKLKSSSDIEQYLQHISKSPCDFGVNDNSSVLISPTSDKIIVHQHNEYFQKFAFDKSYEKVKNESTIYNLIPQNLKFFQVSKFSDLHDERDKYCSFNLSNKHLKIGKNEKPKIVPALLEFFKTTESKTTKLGAYIEALINTIDLNHNIEMKAQVDILKKIGKSYFSLEVPLGLVHRDFKPWNILSYEKPLIFDFEEAIIDGLPLHDLYNFYTDPIIRYMSSRKVASIILSQQRVEEYNAYLNNLNINIDFNIFLHIYLVEQVIFWRKANELHTSNRYLNLSNYLISKSKI